MSIKIRTFLKTLQFFKSYLDIRKLIFEGPVIPHDDPCNFQPQERVDRSFQKIIFIGTLKLKPTHVEVTLHNPEEPANLRSSSFRIPLGHTTTVYITPKATIIDDDGKELTEDQRHCRLSEDIKDLKLYQVYTKEACLLECQLLFAFKRCGCYPWNYPPISKVSVFSGMVATSQLLMYVSPSVHGQIVEPS